MLHFLDPLRDPRWPALLAAHPEAGVFHSVEWLTALQQTYGYQPVVVTTSAPGEPLANAAVFCRVHSWITGKRLVSLPFSDHCEPLTEHEAGLEQLLVHAPALLKQEGLRYIEFRPVRANPCWQASASYCFHVLDLAPSLDDLFKGLHGASIQRKIRRAERDKIAYSEGRSPEFVDRFYELLLLTRQRHALPPQPKAWFENLAAAFPSGLKIRIASCDGKPVAAILTISRGSTMTYKYGCSNQDFHPTGGMQMLMWRAIEDAKQSGLRFLDLGRSDLGNAGLIAYKDKWGAHRSTLSYFRIPAPAAISGPHLPSWKMRAVSAVFSRLPAAVRSAAGGMLYRHMG